MTKTLKELSKEIGYSLGTVSRAINDKKSVSESTKKKILEELEKRGYQPNRIAQSLVNQQSHLIGVILPDISNGFFSSITRYLEHALESAGYHMLLFNTDWNTDSEKDKILLAQANQVDGIILKPVSTTKRFKRLLSVPTVLISQEYDDSISWIDIDNFGTGYQAAQHLIACGYKKMAFVSCYPDNNISYVKRRNGFLNALQENNISIPSEYITSCMPGISEGYKKMAELFALPDPPDSVFCLDDFNAFGFLSYANEHGINIPEDFGIIGCNDTEFAKMSQINLTTISHSLPQMAASAVSTIINMIEQKDNWNNQRIVLTPSFIYRSTTKAPKHIKNP